MNEADKTPDATGIAGRLDGLVRRDEAEVIAHEIYCHAGECGGNPSCFYSLNEWKRQMWVEAVRVVLTHHGFQFRDA